MSHDVEMLKRYTFQKPLRILISGSHGLLGSALYYYLNFMGHEVYRLERKQQKTEEKIVMWDSTSGRVQLSDLENFDAVINLSGENIGKGRWTKKKKDKILKSRVTITENLACAILKLKSPPKLFINASAVGFYGSKGNDAIPENSPPGKGMFISEVCQHWERAARELEERGIRVVLTRFGAVLSPKGGMLKKFLLPFQLGLGGKIGSGKQFMSWITIDDLVAAVYHILMTSSIKGAVNIVSPQPIRNEEFAKALAKKIKRWQGPPLPIFALKLFFGQKGEELFLASIRAYPEKLIQSHFDFHYPSLQQAFDHLL
ncbi:MAG: TIGR01777 family protein [Simkania negevensis]|nr:TIGR01777 family protein [Simkania negevensis]